MDIARGSIREGFSRGARTRRAVALILTVLGAVVCSLALAHTAFAQLKDSPDRTPRIDGTVYDTVRVGNTLYLGGQFQRVGSVTRYNLAAVDATTGALKSWNPRANGTVLSLAASPDGNRIYAGGSFIAVDRSPRVRVAAIDAATGNAVAGWNPAANASVRAIATRGDDVFLGGAFRAVDGRSRRGLAVVGAGTGELDPGWRPAVRGLVRDLQISGPRLYVAGEFSSIANRARRNLASLRAPTGTLTNWRPNPGRPIFDVLVSGGRVYTAQGGKNGAIAAYGPRSGRRAWMRGASGDAQALAFMGRRLYVGGHFDTLSGVRRYKVAAVFPSSGKVDRRWTPRLDKGVWTITPDPMRGKLYVGGTFDRVSGRLQPGLTRFSRVQ